MDFPNEIKQLIYNKMNLSALFIFSNMSKNIEDNVSDLYNNDISLDFATLSDNKDKASLYEYIIDTLPNFKNKYETLMTLPLKYRIRLTAQCKLYDILIKYNNTNSYNFSSKYMIDMAKIIEKNVFNSCILYTDTNCIIRKWSNPVFKVYYEDKIRSILINLDSYSESVTNDTFANFIIERYQNNTKNIDNISNMEPKEVNPLHWKSVIDEYDMKEDVLKNYVQLTTDQFKCGRCKQKKTTYYQVQTRSADEASTNFVTCINCGNEWKC
jgi:DNA-directed RNA polymerase subunit M/transcription elongation factor TFIIS